MTALRNYQLLYVGAVILLGGVLAYRIATATDHDRFGWRGIRKFAFYVAARNLPRNHRLADADLVEPEGIPEAFRLQLPDRSNFLNAYLQCGILQGHALMPAMVAPRPVIPPGSNLVAAPLANQPGVLSWMDAGMAVSIDTDDTKPLAARVIVVTCSPPADVKSCVALLDVTGNPVGDAQKWRFSPAASAALQNPCSIAPAASDSWLQRLPRWLPCIL
jgi:hypothetical protein